MPRPAPTNNVIFDFDKRAVVCTRCDQTHYVAIPCSATTLVAFIKAAQVVHTACKPVKPT